VEGSLVRSSITIAIGRAATRHNPPPHRCRRGRL
jgi:hypothetical protein